MPRRSEAFLQAISLFRNNSVNSNLVVLSKNNKFFLDFNW